MVRRGRGLTCSGGSGKTLSLAEDTEATCVSAAGVTAGGCVSAAAAPGDEEDAAAFMAAATAAAAALAAAAVVFSTLTHSP